MLLEKAMYNLLLDPMPDEYAGYLIRTDYRIGIQIAQALEDQELAEHERLYTAVNLLFGEGVPDAQTAFSGLRWFMAGGQEVQSESGEDDENSVQYFSFEHDAGRLYSGFRRVYGVDLDRVDMHWFRFLRLFGDLGECALTQVIDIRTADLSKMDKSTKAAYLRMRRQVALPQPESPEEAEFMALLGGGVDGP